MATSITKRQQARNERALQDLIRTIPGNDRCADCSAKNPGWASWNLGIFLCMRCAALHRKLGTHISKVKSLSLDSWTTEQVDQMKSTGNVLSNKKFNPNNTKPDIPTDVDEVDAALEKHIRQKYQSLTLSGGSRSVTPAARQNTGSTGAGSWNEDTAALPPKTGKKFGFSLRSSSSTFPRQKADRFTPPMSPTPSGDDRDAGTFSPQKMNKPSQMFGMKITTIDNNFNAKLEHLRDMGFSDNRKNTDILKSMNGNLDKAVEALIRLGEGSKTASRSVTPAPGSLTPVSLASNGASGITIEKQRQPQKSSSNPWEVRESSTRSASQPVFSQSAEGPRAQSVPPPASWNPFLSQASSPQPQMPGQPQSLEGSFQNLNVSPTGAAQPSTNYPVQYLQTPYGTNPWYAQSISQSPVHSSPVYGQQFQTGVASAQSVPQSNPFLQQNSGFQQQYQQAQTQQTYPPATNPWASKLQQQTQQPPSLATANPFGTAWQQPSLLQQATTASPAAIYDQQADFFSTPQPVPHRSQPTFQQPQQQQQQQQPPQPQLHHSQSHQQLFSATPVPQQYQQQPQQQYGMMQPNRHDKTSILALYKYPQLAPQRPLQTLPEDAAVTPNQQQEFGAPQRSVTMPVQALSAGSMNPFAQQTLPPGPRHVSNESVDFQNLTGRQSPDAFAGLSARFGVR